MAAMPPVRAVLFDFDGVLCTDRFYSTLSGVYPETLLFVRDNIFGGLDKYADRWMRGQLSYQQINKLISEATRIPLDGLAEMFVSGVRAMTLNSRLLEVAMSLKQSGVQTAIVTNNMDIFSQVTVPEKHLAAVFPVIVNSSDHGLMKHDQDGKLFDIALGKLGLNSYDGVWLIDDSDTACSVFERKGGRAHRYAGLEGFEQWLDESHVFR
jgi:FMN phosphatase YigB (HAD superfamily)